MPLTAAQTAAKTFLTTSQANYTSPIDGSVDTVANWYTIGADNVVIPLMNDLAFGASLGKTATVSSLDSATIKVAVAGSSDYGTMLAANGVMTSLTWLISESPVPKSMFASISGGPLDAYANAKAAFLALTTTSASVWGEIVDDASAAFTQADLTAIRAS